MCLYNDTKSCNVIFSLKGKELIVPQKEGFVIIHKGNLPHRKITNS